jgi:type III secretion protein D
MTQDLELRVLAGLHEGARCTARDGALIGSDTQCDVVLGDDGIAPEAARLWLGDECWRLSAHDDSADATPELPFGAAFPLGPIHITVARTGDPWPDCCAPAGAQAASQAAATDATRGTAPALRLADLPTAPSAAGRKARAGLQWVLGGILVLLVFGAVASFSPTRVQSSPRVNDATNAAGTALRQAQRILRDLGLSERVQASLTPDKVVLVQGWVLDQGEQDRLSSALAALWPFPALRLHDQSRVAASALERVKDLDLLAAIDYPAPTRLAIRGIAASDAVRAAALERWSANSDAFPQTTIDILLAEHVGAAVTQAVAAADLPSVGVDWIGKSLIVKARGFDAAQIARLQSIVDTLNGTYMGALLIQKDEPAPATLPFRVHTIVGGTQPWVMLEDGTRIVVGGTHGAYRLKSIEDGAVVFDGPATTVIKR